MEAIHDDEIVQCRHYVRHLSYAHLQPIDERVLGRYCLTQFGLGLSASGQFFLKLSNKLPKTVVDGLLNIRACFAAAGHPSPKTSDESHQNPA